MQVKSSNQLLAADKGVCLAQGGLSAVMPSLCIQAIGQSLMRSAVALLWLLQVVFQH